MKKLFLAFVLLLPMGAWADPSASAIQELCLDTGEGEPNANLAKYKACLGFLRDVSDPPAWASPEKLRQVWLNYARTYPQEQSWDAVTVATNAFNEAFPPRRP